MEGQLQRTSDRQGFVPVGEFFKKKTSVRSKDPISLREPPG